MTTPQVPPISGVPSEERRKIFKESWKQLVNHLSIETLLQVRQKTKEIHAEQIAILDEVLREKGHSEPHHEVLTHGRE